MRTKILVADDDSKILELFSVYLDDYEVVTVSDGKELLETLSTEDYIDIAFVDVFMPGISGIELLREIKINYPDVKVVIMTAYESREILVQALRGQADDFVAKPIVMDEVESMLKRLIDSRLTVEPAVSRNPVEKVKWIKKQVRKNYYKTDVLREISDELCMSAKYVGRLFKEVEGISFKDYRISVRMEKAKRFIKRNDMTMSQIAVYLGYRNPESFSKAFKKYADVLPTEYRERYYDNT